MDALADMARQLAARPSAAQAQEADNRGKSARMRQLLRDNGQQTARELAAQVGLRDTGLVGALLKHDMHAGRVTFSDGYYRWSDAC